MSSAADGSPPRGPAAELDRTEARAHMRRALALAERGWGQTAPNPMVGAVVVAGGAVVGEGYHARFGLPHAEVGALREAGDGARGATLYVSLEPCAHYGKTPPCADKVIDAGIARVVIAAPDPCRIARGGADRLREAGVEVEIGLEREAALELNAPFFNAIESARPWVTLKLALSANGRIADPSGEHRWITGVESRREVHRLRANADAIAVGVGTAIADDPSLTVRDVPAPRIPPRRVVFDSTLRTPRSSTVIRTAREIETNLVGRLSAVPIDRAAMAREAGATVLLAPTLHDSVEALRQREIRSLFVEGGAQLAGSLLREGLVDRLIIFRSPLVLGDTAPAAFAHAPEGFEASLSTTRVVDERRFGEDTMTIYALHDVPLHVHRPD
jgi:diaminohydroxyphosphoribosylaminopyrimidine deaminase/5-amino-6-(5-phosphoribosylamino)uracil reductase